MVSGPVAGGLATCGSASDGSAAGESGSRKAGTTAETVRGSDDARVSMGSGGNDDAFSTGARGGITPWRSRIFQAGVG